METMLRTLLCLVTIVIVTSKSVAVPDEKQLVQPLKHSPGFQFELFNNPYNSYNLRHFNSRYYNRPEVLRTSNINPQEFYPENFKRLDFDDDVLVKLAGGGSGTGVAIHPDGAKSYVGSRTYGIGKRSAEPHNVNKVDIKETDPSQRSDIQSSDKLEKNLTPFDRRYPFQPFYHQSPYGSSYSSLFKQPFYPEYLAEEEKQKYGWQSGRYYGGYNGYYPNQGGGYYPSYDRHSQYGRYYNPYYNGYQPRYNNYWNLDPTNERRKEILATKEVSVHPKGGVSYVSRRIHGT